MCIGAKAAQLIDSFCVAPLLFLNQNVLNSIGSKQQTMYVSLAFAPKIWNVCACESFVLFFPVPHHLYDKMQVVFVLMCAICNTLRKFNARPTITTQHNTISVQ